MLHYNRIAGQSLDRLAALSDGIFAVAMTLLVLDLHVPVGAAIQSEATLIQALAQLFPRALTYVMSFLTLGIFWVGQQTQLNHFARTDRNLTWIQLAFLLTVTVTPFSTALLAEYVTFRTALTVYWLNILLLGVTLYASLHYATKAKLLNDDVTDEVKSALARRIVVAQALYAIGALLCVINTYVSIAVIVLVQLHFAIGTRIRWLERI
jgi:uncharacterized membrane protein